jgi:hypothetical protein
MPRYVARFACIPTPILHLLFTFGGPSGHVVRVISPQREAPMMRAYRTKPGVHGASEFTRGNPLVDEGHT